jgi:hypothetical protein
MSKKSDWLNGEDLENAQLTFDEWRELRYHVIKGEKHSGRDSDGSATFAYDQVDEDDDYFEDLEYLNGGD